MIKLVSIIEIPCLTYSLVPCVQILCLTSMLPCLTVLIVDRVYACVQYVYVEYSPPPLLSPLLPMIINHRMTFPFLRWLWDA